MPMVEPLTALPVQPPSHTPLAFECRLHPRIAVIREGLAETTIHRHLQSVDNTGARLTSHFDEEE